MAKRMVICVDCGRRFDAEAEGARYDASARRYQCMDCARKDDERAAQRKIELAGRPDLSGVKKQKPIALILKLVFGIMFVCVSFTQDMEFGARIVGIVLGLGLIAWALFPFYMAKKALKEAQDRQQAEIDRQSAEKAKALNQPWTCPACGAKTKGAACEYCGTAKP